MKSSNKGFSLIELMIAVIIIGIITAVAWPSYKSSVEKSRNAEAKNALLNMAALQTQYFTENRKYTENVVDLGQETEGGSNNLMKTANGTHFLKIITPNVPSTYYMGTEPASTGSSERMRYYIDHLGRKYHGPKINVKGDDFEAPDGNNNNNWTPGWD